MWPGPSSLVPCSLGLEHGGAGPEIPRSGALDLLNKNSNWYPRPLAQRSSQEPARSQHCQAGNRCEVLTPWCLSLGRRLRHRSPALRTGSLCPPPSPEERERLAGSSKVRPGKGKKVPAEWAGRPCRQAHPTHSLGPISEPPTGPGIGLSTQRAPHPHIQLPRGRAGARGTRGFQSRGARARPRKWLLRREDPPSAQTPLPGALRRPGSQARPVEGSVPRHGSALFQNTVATYGVLFGALNSTR